MTYPLHMQNKALAGYALANDEAEHIALSDLGYEPKYAGPAEDDGETLETVRAKLDEAGIAYDKRWGLARLQGLLPK